MPQALPDDHLLAAELAANAGRLLVDLRARRAAGGVDPKALGREGDAEAHQLLMAGLAAARPGDAVLSEEGLADPARLTAERVWIVDPLDGTREYSEVPRTDWAVHVALVMAGEPVAGAVALPARGLTLATDPPPPPPPAWDGPPRVLVSRSRPPVEAARGAGAWGGDLARGVAAAPKAGAVALGEADGYADGAGRNEGDALATEAVAGGTGLDGTRPDSSPFVYNRPDPDLPDLVTCRSELA